jgi:hypothetical protein
MYLSVCDRCHRPTTTGDADWKLSSLSPQCSACGARLTSKGKRVAKKTTTKKTKKVKPQRGEAISLVNNLKVYETRAAEHGLQITVSRVNGYRFDHCHVMVNQGKHRVANYWPSNGTLVIGSEKLKAENIDIALTMIVERVGTMHQIGCGATGACDADGGENKTKTQKSDYLPSQSNVTSEVTTP